MKDRNNKKFLFIALGGVGIVFFVIIMALISSHSAKKEAQESEEVKGNNQMPFSGLTANVANNLKHQINSIASNVSEGQKEIWQALKRKKQALLQAQQDQVKQKASLNALDQGTVNAGDTKRFKDLEKRIDNLSHALDKRQANFTQEVNSLKAKMAHQYAIGSGNDAKKVHNKSIVWITDITNQSQEISSHSNDPLHGSLSDSLALFDTPKKPKEAINANSNHPHQSNKPVVIPAFTIPNPSIFTRAIALTPLVGRIPKGDNHLVWAPFQVLFMIEHPNVTSNGHSIAEPLGKMLGTATCVGDLLAGANACHVDVLTYVFPDGTIATAKVDDQGKQSNSSSMDFKGLGYLTDAYGNPQIIGNRKSALGLRIAMTGGTAAVSAYGGALSQASTIANNNGMGGIIQQVTNANKYAMGQAINGLAQGVNKEWDDASKNMFDYIYTNNWDETTHRLKRFNIVITQQLDFDYIKHGRKLSYENHYGNKRGGEYADDLILG